MVVLCDQLTHDTCILSKNGSTPLMKAAEGGHVECVRLLLDKGATVNRYDKVSAVCDLS